MKGLQNILKSPLSWIMLAVMVLSILQSAVWNDTSTIIRSDGRGYYAYLPALIIHNDSSFKDVVQAEGEYGKGEQIYLYKDVNGNSYNKYFPGLAILQAPFFIIACAISWVSGEPVDGYNDIFMWMFLIGSLVYFFVGLISFSKVLQLRFTNSSLSTSSVLTLLIVASPILYYAVTSPSFTHIYSFALFGVFSLLVMKIKDKSRTVLWFLLALTLGLIFLVRPTNILVIFAVPFLLGDFDSLKSFFSSFLSGRGKIFGIALGSFLTIVSILFVSWYWQTGSWIVWSYNGEGFNFLHPKFWDSLFSYRIGLFVHTPILLLSLLGLFILRTKRYELGMFLLYFLINTWVISAWWCWDYESVFGHRPFTEHLVILFIPAICFIEKYQKMGYILLLLSSVLNLGRMHQTMTGITPVARYNSTNYWSSMFVLNRNDEGRFNFTESCVPHGLVLQKRVIFSQAKTEVFDSEKEFGLSSTVLMPKPRTNERYYFSVKLQKKHDLERFEDVSLIIDATSLNSDERSYSSFKLYNDRNEGFENWSRELVFEGIIHDNKQSFDQVKFYIWNKGGKAFELKNVEFEISIYKN